MQDTMKDSLGVIEALDDLARAFLKVSDVLHDCANELGLQLAEGYTEAEEAAEAAEAAKRVKRAGENTPKPVRRAKKAKTLPGRSGLFDTKRMHAQVTVKFCRRARPVTFADFKMLGLFLTGSTPQHRLFSLVPHIDTGKQYIEYAKRQVERIVQATKPELGGIEWISRTTSDGVVLKA